ncbi:MAG: DUF6186 family protein [Mycobacteriales bacterium]
MTARTLTLAALLALTLATATLYAAGRARRLGLVPLAELLGAATRPLPGRLVVALGWAWLGWHFLAR